MTASHACSAYCVFKSWVSDIRDGEPNTPDLGIEHAYEAIRAEALASVRPLLEAARAYREAHEAYVASSPVSADADTPNWIRLRTAAMELEGAALVITFEAGHVEETAKRAD